MNPNEELRCRICGRRKHRGKPTCFGCWERMSEEQRMVVGGLDYIQLGVWLDVMGERARRRGEE